MTKLRWQRTLSRASSFGFNSSFAIRASTFSMQVVHFHERNSRGVVYPAYDRGVIAGWKVCDDRRFARISWSVAAVLNSLDLISSDDAADDRGLPVVVRGNQIPVA